MYQLQLKNISKTFKRNSKKQLVLDNINLNVKKSEFIAIVGPSGCGKTTLLRIIMGLEHPSKGSIKLDDKNIKEANSALGMVFQEFSLLGWRTVLENVTFGLEMKKLKKEEQMKIAEEYIRLVVLDDFKEHYPCELSGGMKQRVAVARALATNPQVLLMDEPFGALDAQTRNTLQTELIKIWRKTRKTVIFITHNIEEAIFLAQRIVILSKIPSTVERIVENKLPYPRDKLAPDFIELKCDITKHFYDSKDK
ncbi:MAG: nitrate ABC transporter ATP-binding protein [Candidatus Nanohalarchaeota archaeon]|nr:MAG: nitrate ABC transporter ATP-binding protein [Candidatus Nanohaloarchaeota archaeon]